MAVFYHVTPTVNRDSIGQHGLDWRHGGGGIAGSRSPEQDGVFLARDMHEADFFLRIGSRRFAALDVWEVTLEANDALIREFDGFLCWMQVIPPARLRLAQKDIVGRDELSDQSERSQNEAVVAFESWALRERRD